MTWKRLAKGLFAERNSMNRLFYFLGLMLLGGCAPSVKLTTPQPLQVDIHMTLDVNQHEAATNPKNTADDDQSKVLRRRDNRSAELWGMKNDGVVVENARGYLDPVGKSGWDPAYVQRLVAEENQDRRVLYEAQARADARPVASIEAEAGRRLTQQAYVAGSTNTPPVTAKPAVQ